jgi:hypothetical protein
LVVFFSSTEARNSEFCGCQNLQMNVFRICLSQQRVGIQWSPQRGGMAAAVARGLVVVVVVVVMGASRSDLRHA